MNGSMLVTVMLVQALALCTVMSAAWLARRLTGNSGWIDFSWTVAVGAVGALSALYAPGDGMPTSRQWLVALLVVVWSVRLATHIAMRNAHGKDDPRYAALAAEWGADASRRMFQFAQAQAVAAIPLTTSIFIAAHRPGAALGLQDIVGALVLAVAIGGEAVADAQLRRFSADPRNKKRVCDHGLWRWSRHPNYFFQWLGWLAYPVIALAPAGGYPWGWLTITAPALMYWLLVKVSGIPPLEAHMLRSRGASFADYQKRTSAFFPLPPGPRAQRHA